MNKWVLILGIAALVAINSVAKAESTLGIAYQTWNKPLGLWQSPEELEYDLKQMAQLGIHHLRVEFVWGHVETKPDQYDFSRTDLLVKLAERYQMKLDPIIGFQWPPDWMPPEHFLGFQPKGKFAYEKKPSPILNYADPYVQERFRKYIDAVVRHYRGSSAIGAWILGNEFTYLEYNSFRQMGYDEISAHAFIAKLVKKYGTIQKLNAAWKTTYANFKELTLEPAVFKTDQDVTRTPVTDFLEFRREQIAKLVSIACEASKKADPAAKRTYSSIGVLFSQFDRFITSEDFRAISEACKTSNAPLDFYSVNSYLNLNSHESFHLGLSYELTRALTNLPVVFSEFGLSSTEIYSNIAIEKQAKYLRAQYLESIFDGVPQANVFTWTDKAYAAPREQGFGIVGANRKTKPSFDEIKTIQNALRTFAVGKLQADRITPQSRVTFLLPDPKVGFLRWNSYLNETWIVASHFKRLGIHVDFLRPDDLDQPQKLKGIELLVLAKQGLLGLEYLEKVRDRLQDGKFSVLAVSDIPSYEHQKNDSVRFKKLVNEIFGIDVGQIQTRSDFYGEYQVSLKSDSKDPLVASGGGLSFGTWQKVELFPAKDEKLTSSSLRFKTQYSNNEQPFYTIKNHDHGKYAVIIPLAIGNTTNGEAFESRLPYLLRNLLEQDLGIHSLDLHVATSPTTGSTTLQRQIGLQSGGHLLYAQNIPTLSKGESLTCSQDKKHFEWTGLKPNEKMVALGAENHPRFTVGASGTLSLDLKECESELYLSEEAFQRYQNESQPAFPTYSDLTESNRKSLFPPRVYVDTQDRAHCSAKLFSDLNYQDARLGVTQGPTLEQWKTEPSRGLYYFNERNLKQWQESFGVLVFQEYNRLSFADRSNIKTYLSENPERKVVLGGLSGIGKLFAKIRYYSHLNQILFLKPGCESSTPAELATFLELK